jgi:integrase
MKKGRNKGLERVTLNSESVKWETGLKPATGLPSNPHTFRRTFACLLRKAGVDTMTIKDLCRWESLEMV